MDNLNPQSLIDLLDSLECQQALFEEHAHAFFNLTRMCEIRIMEIEQSKEQVAKLLKRLTDAQKIY